MAGEEKQLPVTVEAHGFRLNDLERRMGAMESGNRDMWGKVNSIDDKTTEVRIGMARMDAKLDTVSAHLEAKPSEEAINKLTEALANGGLIKQEPSAFSAKQVAAGVVVIIGVIGVLAAKGWAIASGVIGNILNNHIK